MDKISILKDIINKSNNIVFFGGAGVSTESGIPDFRSQDGLYNMTYKYKPETILSHHFFMNNIDEFYKFYFNKMIYHNILPNYCHKYLANLELNGKLKAVITQNIDDLHEKAGSKNVIHLHGTVKDNYCLKCGKYYSLDELEKKGYKCNCGGIIKPDVVLYEEPLDEDNIKNAIYYISKCDTLIIGGTSLNVYPAASFINYFHGNNLIIINKDVTKEDSNATLVIHEPISQVFTKIDQ
jgi:NAD-dependent deacetylase